MLNELLVGSRNFCIAVGYQADGGFGSFSYYPVKTRSKNTLSF
jgi:hypothetical protein